jgi:bifunctional DNase/RNase
VGQFEAQAIAMKLEGKEPPRPLTHDLLNNIINTLKAKVTSVEVRDLKDQTFYGQVNLEHKGEILKVDARPSDSIALALRSAVPIYVAEAVMEESGLSENKLREAGKEQLKELLKNLDEEQYGKYRV